MNLNLKAYIVLAVVFASSIAACFLLPFNNELVRAAVAAPGVSALFGALFQLMRDEADYEKRLEVQRRDFQFSLGAASHMANTAFDKHAEFSEQYMKELQEAVRSLYREGETPAALGHAGKLYSLRQDYATWLTDRINMDLDEFESALRTLGANAQFIQSTVGNPQYTEKRLTLRGQNFDLFARILGLHNSENIQEASLAEALKGKVRAILGVEELTRLREHLIKQASNAIGAK